MKIVDVIWTEKVNKLKIVCDCSLIFWHWTCYSLVMCPNCNNKELFHSMKPNNYPSMENIKICKLEL